MRDQRAWPIRDGRERAPRDDVRLNGKPVRSVRIDKLIIDPDAAVVGQQQHDQAGRSDRVAAIGDHAPVKLDHVAQLFDAAGEFEPVMPLGDIGLMRRRHPCFEFGVAVHLAGPDIVRAVLDPEAGDLGAAAGRIGFVPDVDIALARSCAWDMTGFTFWIPAARFSGLSGRE
jgi:hypothetical protein